MAANFDIVTYIYEFNNMSKGSLKSFEKKVFTPTTTRLD